MSDAIAPELARRIGLVVLDVDGVLTDGGVYVGRGEDGRAVEMKRFHITDGLGIKLMMWAGIDVVLVSGRASEVTALRAEELGVEYHEAPGGYKYVAVEEVLEARGASWDETALVADDLADVPSLRRVALPVAVANAVDEVRALARWRTTRPGGSGAVREFAEVLLKARGQWTERIEVYFRERSGRPVGHGS